MKSNLPDRLKALGFGKLFVKAASEASQRGYRSFSLSERRRINEEHLKFTAWLSYNEQKERMDIAAYHVINVTEGFGTVTPDLTAALRAIETKILSVNLNHCVFVDQHRAPIEIKRAIFRATKEIERSMAALPYSAEGDLAGKERLQLKYLQDTLYGLHVHLPYQGPSAYEKYFDVLTLDQNTGIIPIRQAVELLLTNNLTDRQGLDAKIAAVKVALERQRTLKRSSRRGKKRNRGNGKGPKI